MVGITDDLKLSRASEKSNEAIRRLGDLVARVVVFSEADYDELRAIVRLTEESDALSLGVDRGAGKETQ